MTEPWAVIVAVPVASAVVSELTCWLFWNSSIVVPAEMPKTSKTRFPVTLVILSPSVPESELGSSRTRVGDVAWVMIVTSRGALGRLTVLNWSSCCAV